jgi:hypothetical protein
MIQVPNLERTVKHYLEQLRSHYLSGLTVSWRRRVNHVVQYP